MKTILRFAAVAAFIAVVAAGATYAATSLTSSASSTTIQACVKTANGDVRIVDGPTQCHRDEHPVTWNVQGPKGDQGAKGDTGAPGLSVQTTALSKGDANCPFGGSELTVGLAAPTFACNGTPGAEGKAGADGTSLTSVDGLTGLACRAATGPGTTQVSYQNNAVIISCLASASGGTGGGGGTGVSCTPPADPPHGVAACDSNGNVVYRCSFGWADTDGNLADGCEQQLDLQNDPHNCGSPGNDVTHQFAHAIGGCRNGTAYIAACDPGYTDLDGNPADGCEQASDACPHPDGLGQSYFDCGAPLGTPGQAASYTQQMAMLAAWAWTTAGTVETVMCGGEPAVAHSNGTVTATWEYSGSLAGYVHLSTDPTPVCPAAGDPTWK